MKKLSILFIILCLAACLIPSVGMIFFPTTQTTENKAMAEAPKLLTEEGALNKSFIADFEDWFTQHIALRNQLVYADAMIQTGLFRESNVSGVIAGTDGWLYYASTLDDYLGTDLMSDRELYNLAHNFSVVEDYAEAHGMDFALTIAPNKNTLYDENMPYYKDHVVNTDHNAKLLTPYLEALDVNYLDLFRMFEAHDEVLYLLRDSHWNNKGACLAYNGIMDTLELPHEDYSDMTPKLVKNENGDLNKMLYSFYGKLEENYDYGLPQAYVYANDVDSVEDGWIITENETGTGSLLMFRDSFGNTLIPFLSNEFQTVYYSKGEPNAIERYVETYSPDSIVIQKVERNIENYLNKPPILTPPTAELPKDTSLATTATTAKAEACMYDMNYYAFSGTVDAAYLQTDSEILFVTNEHVYRAYQTGENGYTVYLKKADFPAATADVQVCIVNDGTCIQALSTQIELPQ